MPTPTLILLLGGMQCCKLSPLGLISAKPAAGLIVPTVKIADVREGLDLNAGVNELVLMGWC